MRWIGLALLVVALSGSLGAPFQRDEVPFESVQRENFDAFAVVRERGDASDAPLRVRVKLLGDGRDVDLTQAEAWLRENANVVLVRDPAGAPLYLTLGDLAATSGRATLGATVKEGMAVEASNVPLANCVAAHEVLHFLGLKHVDDARNLMHPQCTRARLGYARLTTAQQDDLASVESIEATTPRGIQMWATRSA